MRYFRKLPRGKRSFRWLSPPKAALTVQFTSDTTMYETDRMPQWVIKRKLLLITLGIAFLFFVAWGIPNILPPRFEWASVPLAVHIRVTDQELGTPIEGAVVRAPSFLEGPATTSTDGSCEAIARFRATGTLGRSGRMHLYGTISVTADGFQTWERSFVSLFGQKYDYFNKGTSVICTVTLAR